jgi:pyrroloquinoline quinone (PQQ) biosynthesis protein C
MNPEQLKADLHQILADHQLLEHPFYRRWVAGELTMADVGAYAAQYRHFETALPGMLRELGDGLPAGPAADLVAQNLADEESNPAPHAELFEGFASAVGAPAAVPATPATAHLIATYEELIDAGSLGGLSAFVAYEMQAASIAASKADGLRRMYGLDAAAVQFWEVHASMDVAHADWTIAALADLAGDADGILTPARRAADAWWAFLDEREVESQALLA